MKDFLTILLSVLFAVVNVVSVFHGKSWDRTGSGISWHLPFVFLVGGASFVAMSHLSRSESSHTFIAVLDGVLMIFTVGFLYYFFRDPATRVQWAGIIVTVAGIVMILAGRK